MMSLIDEAAGMTDRPPGAVTARAVAAPSGQSDPERQKSMTVETLTAEERAWLEADLDFQKWDVRRKVLRIIDAHAADRAESERELREVERENALDIRYLRDVAESQITQLQRDRESLVARLEDVQGALDVAEVRVRELEKQVNFWKNAR